jgi:glycolate oxidase FAD binding subunit
MNLGNIPRQVDVVLGLERLDKLVEHDDANLTATIQAGMRVASLQEILGQRRQFFPVDSPHPARATIGGTVAANVNGPRRMMYGGVRDLVVGMKMVLATGAQIKAGGKVVKNVAGYDLCKLFVGSLGTLGIITEATLRVAPLPEIAASFVASGALDRCVRLANEIAASPLLPSAVTILGRSASEGLFPDARTPAVAVWVEGFDAAIGRHLQDLSGMAARESLAGQVLRDELHQRLWEEIGRFGLKDGGVLCRVTVPVTSVAELLTAIDGSRESLQGARYVAHAVTGTIWLWLDEAPPSLAWFAKLTALAQDRSGHAVIAAASAELKRGIDVWGPALPGLRLMREIKRQFDPQDILNPGRFLAYL